MDRHKFRVWDEINKEYTDNTQLLICGSTGNLYHAGVVTSIVSHPRYITEQCTGRKDKHENLTFESDSVLYKSTGKIANGKGFISWQDNLGWSVVDEEKHRYIPFERISGLEIIGNIHESEVENGNK